MPIGILVVVIVVVGIYFARGGGKGIVGEKETGEGCLTGTEKTVVGRTYTITGTETYTIQGKSFDLCCWEVGESSQKKKICGDSLTSPVSYTNGILFETEKNTGEFFKTMERYQKDGKSCQQLFDAKGTVGAENCQDKTY